MNSREDGIYNSKEEPLLREKRGAITPLGTWNCPVCKSLHWPRTKQAWHYSSDFIMAVKQMLRKLLVDAVFGRPGGGGDFYTKRSGSWSRRPPRYSSLKNSNLLLFEISDFTCFNDVNYTVWLLKTRGVEGWFNEYSYKQCRRR